MRALDEDWALKLDFGSGMDNELENETALMEALRRREVRGNYATAALLVMWAMIFGMLMMR